MQALKPLPINIRKAFNFLSAINGSRLAGLSLIAAATVLDDRNAPTGFIPTEDQGFIVYSVNLPPGASLDRTQKVMDKVDSLIERSRSSRKTRCSNRVELSLPMHAPIMQLDLSG